MDWFRIPPLNSLRAFAAVAETGSFKQAAERLAVTHAAVSQQVKSLETRIGVPLVAKDGRGISLTDQGRQLAQDLDAGFSMIERGIARLAVETAEQPVHVTMSPAFAVEWLMPKLADFQQQHPEITLLLNPTSKLLNPEPGGPDVAIRYRDKRRPTPELPAILVTDMVIVGTPELIDGHQVDTPQSLTELPWLQELGTNEVADWLRYRGIVPDKPINISHMPGNLIMSAVRRGDGLTYSARAFFLSDISSGQIVMLFSEPLFGLYYVQTRHDPIRPAVRTFVDWLLDNSERVSS